MREKGLIAMAGGIAAISVSFHFPWGPCETPGTALGIILFFGGVLAFLAGGVILSIGIWKRRA